MSEPLDLEAIEARAKTAWALMVRDALTGLAGDVVHDDVPDLIAEVRRLRRRLADAEIAGDHLQQAWEVEHEDNVKLRAALRGLLAWSKGGACSDCNMFRRAPSELVFQHHKDCGFLEDINKALAVLGREPDEGHSFEEPAAEMRRLSDERTRDCNLQMIDRLRAENAHLRAVADAARRYDAAMTKESDRFTPSSDTIIERAAARRYLREALAALDEERQP